MASYLRAEILIFIFRYKVGFQPQLLTKGCFKFRLLLILRLPSIVNEAAENFLFTYEKSVFKRSNCPSWLSDASVCLFIVRLPVRSFNLRLGLSNSNNTHSKMEQLPPSDLTRMLF